MATKKDTTEPTKDVAIPEFSDDEYRDIESWEDALSLLTQAYGSVDVAEEIIGDGFAVLKDKRSVVGAPMLFINWKFVDGDQGEFAVIRAVANTVKGFRKLILTDGSTGIYDQLRKYSDRFGKFGGLAVRNGLRASDYEVQDEETGKMKSATTFYLDTSAE